MSGGPTDAPVLRLHLIAAPPESRARRSCDFGPSGGLIGRGPDVAWELNDDSRTVSRQHARIEFKDDRYWITEAGTNGIYLGETDIRVGKGRRMPVRDGLVLRFGQVGIYVIGAELIRPAATAGPGPDFVDATEPSPVVVPGMPTSLEEPVRDATGMLLRLVQEVAAVDAARVAFCASLGLADPDADPQRERLFTTRSAAELRGLLEADGVDRIARTLRGAMRALADHQHALAELAGGTARPDGTSSRTATGLSADDVAPGGRMLAQAYVTALGRRAGAAAAVPPA